MYSLEKRSLADVLTLWPVYLAAEMFAADVLAGWCARYKTNEKEEKAKRAAMAEPRM
ncbi:MAG: hypothetical protein QM296_07185 [Bacillota bacterium]|nr:hypothetical protein [Bacillota bacterium]